MGGRSLSSTPVAINNGPLSLRIAILLRLYRADAGKLLGVDYQTDRLHYAVGYVEDEGRDRLAARGDHHARGAVDRASELYRQSLTLLRTLSDRSGIAEALERLAGIVGAGDQPEAGPRLFGAADALREAIAVARSELERGDYNRDVEATRARLSEIAFSAAWEVGRALSMERAIELAEAASDTRQRSTGTR